MRRVLLYRVLLYYFQHFQAVAVEVFADVVVRVVAVVVGKKSKVVAVNFKQVARLDSRRALATLVSVFCSPRRNAVEIFRYSVHLSCPPCSYDRRTRCR